MATEKEMKLYRHIGKPPPSGLDAYIEWCDMMAGYLKKRPVGRPKFRPVQRKKEKPKRAEQMRELLLAHGITVLEDSTLEGFNGLNFLPNGRVGGKGLSISVHQFLQNLNGK